MCHSPRSWNESVSREDASPEAQVQQIERSYQRRLRFFSARAEKLTKKELDDKLEELIGNGGAPARRRLTAAANKIAAQMRRDLPAKEIAKRAERVAGMAVRLSGRRLRSAARKSKLPRNALLKGLQVDVTDVTDGWQQRQTEMINRAIEEHRQRILDLAKSIKPGTRIETVRKRVRELGGIVDRRISFIAKDQAQRVLGELDEQRARAAGAKHYIWTTQRDSRVRPKHRAREGKKFSWDDPPSDGHPGQPPNCRCVAVPVWD